MMTETVADLFSAYREQVIPAAAPPIQLEECQRAFYAGIYAVLMTMCLVINDDSDGDQGVAWIGGLLRECESYAAGLTPPPTIKAH